MHQSKALAKSMKTEVARDHSARDVLTFFTDFGSVQLRVRVKKAFYINKTLEGVRGEKRKAEHPAFCTSPDPFMPFQGPSVPG